MSNKIDTVEFASLDKVHALIDFFVKKFRYCPTYLCVPRQAYHDLIAANFDDIMQGAEGPHIAFLELRCDPSSSMWWIGNDFLQISDRNLECPDQK